MTGRKSIRKSFLNTEKLLICLKLSDLEKKRLKNLAFPEKEASENYVSSLRDSANFQELQKSERNMFIQFKSEASELLDSKKSSSLFVDNLKITCVNLTAPIEWKYIGSEEEDVSLDRYYLRITLKFQSDDIDVEMYTSEGCREKTLKFYNLKNLLFNYTF